jgi:uncharacterized protein (DUF427 family)
MKAIWNNQIIAESNDTVIVEGNHYFPREALVEEFIRPSEHRSFCPWKGNARYYTLEVDGKTNPNAVWYYDDPKSAAREIKNRVAFWHGVEVVAP